VAEGEQQFNHTAVDQMWVHDLPDPEESVLILRVDPAIGGKKINCLFVVNVCLVDWRGHRFHVDGFAGRDKQPSSQLRRIFNFAEKWLNMGFPGGNIGIESVNYQEAMAANARKGIMERDAQYDGELIPVRQAPLPVVSITRSPDMRKQERIISLEGPVHRGEEHIWIENPIGRQIVDHLKWFPHGPMDVLDTMHDCHLKVRKPSRPLNPIKRRMHPIFSKRVRSAMLESDRNRTRGLTNTSSLESWRS
jgi:hypothetical protein